ncbi:GMP synthase (glutamine-hydrolyzing) [Coelomomyces lativittatus]|nr:GMP synthase (glutamine-hydrolyzing) [Coelomomyces lativittatus]KAJ1509045.1 GMP synthase (glutamine-hydrolyzing) [Coelomomyces lativittatus]
MSTFNALEEHACHDTILILDFGSQYTHLITRRIREFNVFCELLPCTTDLTLLKYKPKGIILSGSPFSVYDHDAPHVHPSLWDMEIPILGICYGLQV